MAWLGLFMAVSCGLDESYMGAEDCSPPEEHAYLTTDGMTVLGRKLQNPYSVANMRKALANLSPQTRAGVDSSHLTTTHYYVRFLPKNEAQIQLIKRDSTVFLYAYPLDHEIAVYGTYYHDPSVPDSLPTWQYASVEASKWPAMSQLGVEHEVLEELFIPDETPDVATKTASGTILTAQAVEALVDEALYITGNEEPKIPGTKANWYPSGYITYYDEVLGRTIGLDGIKVKARRWFTTHTGFANASTGYYRCDGSFNRPANYSFDFERYDFNINGDGVRTTYDGPKTDNPWNYHFSRANSETEYFGATIFRGAFYYYYRDIGGLKRPPENSFWNRQLNIRAINDNSQNSNALPARRWFDGDPIEIFRPARSSIQIFATTIHELAHVAHWKLIVDAPNSNRNRDYNNADDRLVESWAMGAQWYITKKTYPHYPSITPIPAQNRIYTRFVIDLIDSPTDELLYPNTGINYNQGDCVEGYSIVEIQNALPGSSTPYEWNFKIKELYENPTESYLGSLYSHWFI